MADDDQKMNMNDDAVVQDEAVVSDAVVSADGSEPEVTEPVADLNELELPAPEEEADDATSDSDEEVAEAEAEMAPVQKDSENSDDQTAGESEEPEKKSDSTDESDATEVPSPSGSSEETPKVEEPDNQRQPVIAKTDDPNAKWYVIHTFAGHENKVLTTLKQRVEAEHLEHRIFDILVPTQDKIEIRSGKKETVKEKIFPGYILVKMILDDNSWLTVRTTQGVTSFIGAGNKPIPISEAEVASIVKFTTQGAAPTFKDVFMVDDTVKIVDGPFSDFIGKVDSVDKEKGRVRVLVSIFGRETPVELDFLQVQKL